MNEVQKVKLSADLQQVLEKHGQTSAIIIMKNERELNTIALQGSAENNSQFMQDLGMHINSILQEHLQIQTNAKLIKL